MMKKIKIIFCIMLIFIISCGIDEGETSDCNFGEAIITTGDDWRCFDVNETIQDNLATQTFLPVNISTVLGTLLGGDIGSINRSKDGLFYNVSESAGVDAITIHINFSDIPIFNNIVYRYLYTQSSTHALDLCLWDYDVDDWDCTHGTLIGVGEYIFTSSAVEDPSDHIFEGLVQLKIDHIQNGNPAHAASIDYFALQSGISATISPIDEIDPLSFHLSGDTPMEGNANWNNFDLKNVNHLTVVNSSNFSIVNINGTTKYISRENVTKLTMIIENDQIRVFPDPLPQGRVLFGSEVADTLRQYYFARNEVLIDGRLLLGENSNMIVTNNASFLKFIYVETTDIHALRVRLDDAGVILFNVDTVNKQINMTGTVQHINESTGFINKIINNGTDMLFKELGGLEVSLKDIALKDDIPDSGDTIGNASDQAFLGYGLIMAYNSYRNLLDNNNFSNGFLLGADRFTTAVGLTATINTTSTNASFNATIEAYQIGESAVGGSDTIELTGYEQVGTATRTGAAGIVATMKQDGTLTKITKKDVGTGSEPTRALLRDSSHNNLATAFFVGDVATFNFDLTDGITYEFMLDSEGSNWERGHDTGITYPISKTTLDYIKSYDDVGGDVTTWMFSVESVTITVTGEPSIGNVVETTDLINTGTPPKGIVVYLDSDTPGNSNITIGIRDADSGNFSIIGQLPETLINTSSLINSEIALQFFLNTDDGNKPILRGYGLAVVNR